MAAVSFYEVVLWLHITAVVVGFGGTFAYGVLLAAARRSAPRSLPGLLGALQANDRSLVTTGGVLVLITGLYLTVDRWDFGELFIGWGIIAIVVLLGLVHGYFIPNERRAQEAAERDIEASGAAEVEFGEGFEGFSVGLARMGAVAGLIVVLTIYVMVAKPFA